MMRAGGVLRFVRTDGEVGLHSLVLGAASSANRHPGQRAADPTTVPRALGLAGRLPYLRLDGAIPGLAGHWKLDAIDRHAGRSRPLAWIDDAHDETCVEWASRRPGPTLLVTTDPAAGLAAERGAWLLQWAAGTGAAAEAEQLQLADTAYTGGSRAVTSNHVAPASPEPNTSPVVEPK